MLRFSIIMLSFYLSAAQAQSWRVDSDKEWQAAAKESDGLVFKDGFASLKKEKGIYRSNIKQFAEKRRVTSITLTQSPIWQNWTAVPKVAPKTLDDAPVFLVKGPQDYWLFGRYRANAVKNAKGNFKAEKASLDGFDVPLLTTPQPNVFKAPGGLNKDLGGYHAWQSRDMKNWVHHGPVTEKFSKWVTTAEFVDGKTYIYYDFPNDQDPHVYIDEDLTDGKPGKNVGRAFKDPSDGSDCAVIRDLQGNFHLIYEDWTPINARRHSWDSPLAGHAVSSDGVSDFKIVEPVVDERTKATGKTGTYNHPHWKKEDPENFKTNIAEYQIHEPEQNAFGDWAAIAIGGQYYLFADYHPVKDKIRIGWFTSSSLNKKFTFCDEIGKGHPDPDIGFAEGKFYLIHQTSNDYISPGPWVETVKVCVGADTDKDGQIDHWTEWQEVKESYDYIKGFAKQIKRNPAALDLSKLPEAYGFCFEIDLEDATENKSSPVLDSVEIEFEK